MAPTAEYEQERKGFWREPGGEPTSEVHALEAWVPAAHELLCEVAESYHAHLDLEEFAEKVQVRSLVRTSRAADRWVEKVLAPVAAWSQRQGEPSLVSLVVADPRADGIEIARRRLACYVWAGSAPADGGVPAPLAPTRGSRSRSASTTRVSASTRAPRESRPAPKPRVAASDRPVTVCPTCFMAVPATGVCDNCD